MLSFISERWGQEALGADLMDRDELRKWNQLALATCGGRRGLIIENGLSMLGLFHVSKPESLYLHLQPGAVRTEGFWKDVPVYPAGTFCFPILLLYLVCQSVLLEHKSHRSGRVACFVHCLGFGRVPGT